MCSSVFASFAISTTSYSKLRSIAVLGRHAIVFCPGFHFSMSLGDSQSGKASFLRFLCLEGYRFEKRCLQLPVVKGTGNKTRRSARR